MKNSRRVWIFIAGDATTEECPLAVLLDGKFWAQSMPVRPALTSLTHRRQLPPTVYVLIDATDTTHRAHKLPCNADFWLTVQQELLPQVKAIALFNDRAGRTVVAGQSFGGPSMLYTGLYWPERFGCVLSQPDSYWWPHRGRYREGMLLEQLNTGEVSTEGLHIVLEASVREPMIMQTDQTLYAQLHPLRESISWRQADGGHDTLCWHNGLIQGLVDLWQPLLHDES